MKIMKSLFLAAGLTTALITLIGCGTKSTTLGEDAINRVKYSIGKICSPTAISMTTPETIDQYIETTDEYHIIVKTGDPALKYMLQEFSEDNGDKSREYVMAKACSKILGEDETKRTWTTGREWYEGYLLVNS